jgi:hypothetical protein
MNDNLPGFLDLKRGIMKYENDNMKCESQKLSYLRVLRSVEESAKGSDIYIFDSTHRCTVCDGMIIMLRRGALVMYLWCCEGNIQIWFHFVPIVHKIPDFISAAVQTSNSGFFFFSCDREVTVG